MWLLYDLLPSKTFSRCFRDFGFMTWFCIAIRYYSREDSKDAAKYVSGNILDDRPICVDFDWAFQEG